MVLQDEFGQIAETHSISAGLDYPSIGPEHAYLQSIGRVEYHDCSDDLALEAFHKLSETRGDHPRAGVVARPRLAAAQRASAIAADGGRGESERARRQRRAAGGTRYETADVRAPR